MKPAFIFYIIHGNHDGQLRSNRCCRSGLQWHLLASRYFFAQRPLWIIAGRVISLAQHSLDVAGPPFGAHEGEESAKIVDGWVICIGSLAADGAPVETPIVAVQRDRLAMG